MDKRKYWGEELVRFAISPTYYIYVLSIILTIALGFMPEFNKAVTAENAVLSTVATEAARFFASELGMALMFVPAFAIATACVRDKERMKRYGKVLREELPGTDAVLIRAGSMLVLLFLPLLIASTYADILIAGKCGKTVFGGTTGLVFVWLLPTVIFVTGLVSAITEWTNNCIPGILIELIVWIFTQGSTDDYGDYFSCVAIRHAGFEGANAVAQNATALAVNRLVVTVLGLAFVFVAIRGYEFGWNRTKAKKTAK